MIEKRINEKRNKMKIRQYIKRVATLALMVALLAPLQEVWGQVTGNRYQSSYTYGNWWNEVTVTTSDKAIQHKPAKWYDQRAGGNYVDTFDDEVATDGQKGMIHSGDGTTLIQAAHTLVDTIYMHLRRLRVDGSHEGGNRG